MEKCGVVTEEKFISHAQYLDLIYRQSATLYDKIANAPRPAFTIPPPTQLSKDSHVDDGVISSSRTKSAGRPSGQTLFVSNQATNASENTLASKINVVSSDKGKNLNEPTGKKMGKNKKNKKIPLQRNHLIPLLWQGNLVMHV